jgi:hypothetical protein
MKARYRALRIGWKEVPPEFNSRKVLSKSRATSTVVMMLSSMGRKAVRSTKRMLRPLACL